MTPQEERRQTAKRSSEMPCFNTSLMVLSLVTLSLLSFNTEAATTYSSHFCDNSTTFSPNSTYQANINHLLSSLSSNVTNAKNGFYNTTAGQGNNVVYGTFLCRGDVSVGICGECVANASKDIVKRCRVEKMGVIWYDECTVRYSDQNIFSIIREVPGMLLSSSQSISDEDRFNDLLASTVKGLASRAADDHSGKKFATGEAKFSSFQTLYSLVQCTPDLSDALCDRCFQSAIASLPMCCSGKAGGRVLLPSCNIRYEMYPFYRSNGTAVVPSPSSATPNGKRKISSQIIIAIIAPVAVVMILLSFGVWFLRRKARKKYNALEEARDELTTSESLQFDLGTIQAATNNFSASNKIGEGGFGEVYRGKLINGQEIAVKRLSKHSGQGAEEFKNEVVLVAKLQHRNLVRLLGFCLEGQEKILVYEYVQNKSLDCFLFDPEKQGYLDWSTRCKILGGIARGILYLHEDSRLRIIHRDLKASNILLDQDMNAKISDFGMARIFGVDQTQGNTKRIVGTFGYMSPEYAMHGQFSIKSDVFSFGVLVLEIVSGKKNSSFYQSDGSEDLLSYAWKLWREGNPLGLIDSNLMKENYSRNEVIRCIHVGLLCVQEDPAERPTMASLVLLLDGHSVTLPTPQKPAFFFHSRSVAELNMPTNRLESSDQFTGQSAKLSLNEVSITEVEPR